MELARYFQSRLLALTALRSLTPQEVLDLRTIRQYELESAQLRLAPTE